MVVGEGTPNSFCGWIELVAVIESARHNGGMIAEGTANAASAEPALGYRAEKY